MAALELLDDERSGEAGQVLGEVAPERGDVEGVLLGASRQRVNQELKGFEREGAVRIEPTRLVVLSKGKLLAIANG